jgi:DNA end-binding protein Ku
MASTIWKGVIEFGKVKVPVRFFSAIADRAVHFNLLHKKDKVRVRQAMVNPDTNEEVPSEEIVKGLKLENGNYALIDKADLETLTPPESRTIEIVQFVPNEQINHQWYERAYYLGPDGETEAYSALMSALSDHKREGVARWVMRKRRYIGSLQVSHGYLIMVSLRYADEVILADHLPKPGGKALAKKELALAEQLVETLHGDFNPSDYHDEHRQRILDFVQAKSKGRAPKLRLVKPPPDTDEKDLLDVLSKSLKSSKKERASA